jgi:hypothetical protein
MLLSSRGNLCSTASISSRAAGSSSRCKRSARRRIVLDALEQFGALLLAHGVAEQAAEQADVVAQGLVLVGRGRVCVHGRHRRRSLPWSRLDDLPWSMKITRWLTLRRSPSRGSPHIMVMPSCASSTITSSTSLTISGSSAEVGSSNSMQIGSMDSARAMATRCCWPPESWPGNLSLVLPSGRRGRASSCRVRWPRPCCGPAP